MQGTRPHPDFGAETSVPCGGAGCAHHPDGKQQLSEGCSPCTHTPRGSWCPPASGRLRNNSILTQVPVLWAHLAPFGHRGRPPQMRLLPKCASIAPSPNAPWCWRLPMLRGARAGACLHPEHLREPPALSRGTQAPTRQPHGTHRGTSCAPGRHPTWSNLSPLPGSSGFNQEPTQQRTGQQGASTPLSPSRLLPAPLTREDQSPEPNGTQKLLHKLRLGLGTAASAQTKGSEATGQRQDSYKHLEVAGPVTGPPAPPRDPGHGVPSGMAQQHQSCTASSSHKEFVFFFPLCVFLLHPSVLRSRRCPPGRAACPAQPRGTKPEVKPTHASSGSNTPKKRLFAPNCL